MVVSNNSLLLPIMGSSIGFSASSTGTNTIRCASAPFQLQILLKVVGTISPTQLVMMTSCSGNTFVRVGGACTQLVFFVYSIDSLKYLCLQQATSTSKNHEERVRVATSRSYKYCLVSEDRGSVID